MLQFPPTTAVLLLSAHLSQPLPFLLLSDFSPSPHSRCLPSSHTSCALPPLHFVSLSLQQQNSSSNPCPGEAFQRSGGRWMLWCSGRGGGQVGQGRSSQAAQRHSEEPDHHGGCSTSHLLPGLGVHSGRSLCPGTQQLTRYFTNTGISSR